MAMEKIYIDGKEIEITHVEAVVVGTGAAGLAATVRLAELGVKAVTLTMSLNAGTSRNTGSDKQTYYKLSLSGAAPDSVMDMAQTYFACGSMDGDLALAEAAGSTEAFFRLVKAGVPFPKNEFGEYAGYRTDHDTRLRASSAGPLTSKLMVEALIGECERLGCKIIENRQLIGLLTDDGKTNGIICLDPETNALYAYVTSNVVLATGAPAGLYGSIVYPDSTIGGAGFALERGAVAKNLTEWQYGIASVDFKWNLSGSYQQVLPRYISREKDGSGEREFLSEYFAGAEAQLTAQFRKGYEWPFNPEKLYEGGSSIIDLAIYVETNLRGREVFMDFTKNPSCLNPKLINVGTEAFEYLATSGALLETPFERLSYLNPDAVKLYADHGIDLSTEPLRLAVCAQHNNGGLSGDINWENNLKGLYPIGEINGSHGVRRPGGSALNAGQVGAMRAAEAIAMKERVIEEGISSEIMGQLRETLRLQLLFEEHCSTESENKAIKSIGESMDASAGLLRDRRRLIKLHATAHNERVDFDGTGCTTVSEAWHCRDLLLCREAYVGAMLCHEAKGGGSRGSYLVYDAEGELPTGLPEMFRFKADDGESLRRVIETCFMQGRFVHRVRPVRPIPETEQWFENVWRGYRERTNKQKHSEEKA